MTVVASIVSYVEQLHLFTEPWTVVAICLTTIVAYCTLLYHLGDCLKGTSTDLTAVARRKRILSLREAKGALFLMAEFSIITLILLLGKSFMPCTDTPDGVSVCSLTTFFLTLFCPISIGLLAFSGLAVEDYIFEFKRQEAEFACITIDATIYLKCGNKIKGCLRDLSLLRGKRYFQYILEDKSVVTIDSSDIAAVFLQAVYGRGKTLRDNLFVEGPKSLRLTFPHKEVFNNTRYFFRNNLAVLKIAKPTTRSRYAIVDTQYLQGLDV